MCPWWRALGRATAAVGLALAATSSLHAVIFFSTADQNHNTTAPTGALADSGWQWQGTWGGFTGTAIGPHHFLAAKHVGGTAGNPFVLNGISYTTTTSYAATNCDLRIWEVDGTFPSWAPLYRSTSELSKLFVVFGRGVSRGGEIQVGGVVKGWYWGGGSGILRWGENVVRSIVAGSATTGQLLYATFDSTGGPEEAHVGVGDSSGAVFIQDAGVWKLAGINLSVDGPFNTTDSGNGFNAALFDAGGLYYLTNNVWELVPDQPADVPTGFYATRVSAHVDWIDNILAMPVTTAATDAPLLGARELIVLGAGLTAIGCVYGARGARRVLIR